jgi:uncharacterized protein YjlB
LVSEESTVNEVNFDPEVKSFLLADDGRIPNNPRLPLLLYVGALQLIGGGPAAVCERIFALNQWGGSWRNGIYSFHHYHSTAHEVLAIASGTARVHFGGESGPIVEVKPGDVVIIPAGVGHKNLGSSRDLMVVGAYPVGQSWDLCRGEADERLWARENIARVPLPMTDPIYGKQGPLSDHWLE